MDLNYWKDKYVKARNEYADVLEKLDTYEEYVAGSNRVTAVRHGKKGEKPSLLVRNLVHELVEAQIDSSIPAPKVSAMKQEDIDIAQKCEHKLRNENDRMHMVAVNDLAERFVYEFGGCVYHVEWDNAVSTRNTVGEVFVSILHPRQFIPQPGVYEVQRMDYMFLELAQTKEQIKALYHKDVSLEGEERPEARTSGSDESPREDLVTQIICYYRNDSGGIGRMSWVNDILLEDLPHYHVRRVKVCPNCGEHYVGEACACGCKKGKWTEVKEETISLPTDLGMEQKATVPFYEPDVFPIVVRRNISKFGSLLGLSDIDVIMDQQESLKKLESNIMEKLIKGGSFISLPKGVKIKLDGEQYNVIELKSPAEKAMIDVYNIQADISADLAFTRELMEEAKGLLGVTDSFLGRRIP